MSGLLLPNEMYRTGTGGSAGADYLKESRDKHLIFSEIASMQEKEGINYDEKELYRKARTLGVQYILISSDMTGSFLNSK